MPGRPRTVRRYDHRLIALVRETGDPALATRLGVPRSTAAGWIRRPSPRVVTTPGLDASLPDLLSRVARLEARVRRLTALLRMVLVLLRVRRPDLRRLRFPKAADKARLLRAIDRSHDIPGIRRFLRIAGLSPARLSSWRRAALACNLEDAPSCPRSTPQQLTPAEVSAARELATAPAYRHVPTSRLAVLAQRTGRVLASPTTWLRLVRERGWRRPRSRVHPEGAQEGIRATGPDRIWHIDTTVIRLLDGTRVYLHAVLDNFSRRILAWRLQEKFDPGMSADLLVEAGKGRAAIEENSTTLLADAGVENRNSAVDAVLDTCLLRRVLARTEINFSNSLIEAWWRSLKHQWLFLNRLDTFPAVEKLVAFYVAEHNGVIPHAAFQGQTPDEVHFGMGEHVPKALAAAREEARRLRLETNRAMACGVCA